MYNIIEYASWRSKDSIHFLLKDMNETILSYEGRVIRLNKKLEREIKHTEPENIKVSSNL